METLEILKYIGIGLGAIVAFFIALAIIGGILRLILDIIVFVLIAPFYILFHPVMFAAEPKKCLKNILMKTPFYGDEHFDSEIKINPRLFNRTDDDEIYENPYIKELDEFEKVARYLYGEDIWGNKIK